MRHLAALVIIAGCNSAPVEYPAGPEGVVWRFYEAMVSPPAVDWRDESCLEYGVEKHAFRDNGVCLTGLYVPGGNVEVETEGFPHESGLAHELMHAHQWLDLGVKDPNHASDVWRPGKLVDQANIALMNDGY